MKDLSDIALETWEKHANALHLPKTKRFPRKKSRLYYIKLTFKDLEVYKIGYTSHLVKTRIEGMGLPKGCKAEILQICMCANAKQAYLLEQSLHREHKRDRFYSSIPLIESGYSELYHSDVLQLDRGLARPIYSSIN